MKNLKNLPVMDINNYILDSQEITYLMKHNPDLVIDEEIRVNIGYEYFGLLRISSVYYAITRREELYVGLSRFEAVQKLLLSMTNYCYRIP